MARAVEISNSIFGLRNGPFPCHKTLDYDAQYEAQDEAEEYGESAPSDSAFTADTQHCAGALILMEKGGHQSDCVQLAQRLGRFFGGVIYDPQKLNMGAPVFDTPTQFIEHHCDERNS
jgi:hypothetical protein